MEKDKYYYEACGDAREKSITRWENSTDEQVEARAEMLRNLANIQPRPDTRPPSAYRYEY